MIAGAVGLAPTTAAAAVETADFSPSETKEILGVDDFNWDSGWIPDGSPVQLRMILTAGNSITVEMPGEALYDWDTGEIHFEGDPDAGLFAINVGVDLVAQVKLDVDAPWPLDDIQVETGDLPLVDLASIAESMFTPYLLEGNPARPVEISDSTGFVTLVPIPLTPQLGGLAEGTLDIDMAIDTEGTLACTSIDLAVDDPSIQADSIVQEGAAAPLDAGAGPLPDPFVVNATLVCDLSVDVFVIIRPTLSVSLGFVDYDLFGYELPPIGLPEYDEELKMGPIPLEFTRPEPEPEPETTDGGSDGSDTDPSAGTGDPSDTSATTDTDSGSDSGPGGVTDSASDGETMSGSDGASAGTDTDGVSSFGDADSAGDDAGCGCHSGGDELPRGAWLWLLLGVGLARPRRARA